VAELLYTLAVQQLTVYRSSETMRNILITELFRSMRFYK